MVRDLNLFLFWFNSIPRNVKNSHRRRHQTMKSKPSLIRSSGNGSPSVLVGAKKVSLTSAIVDLEEKSIQLGLRLFTYCTWICPRATKRASKYTRTELPMLFFYWNCKSGHSRQGFLAFFFLIAVLKKRKRQTGRRGHRASFSWFIFLRRISGGLWIWKIPSSIKTFLEQYLREVINT